MTTTAEPQALPDAGRGRCCGDVQWDHKRGKGGCKVPGCGCPKYLPPKQSVPVVVEPAPASPVPGVVIDNPAELGPTEQVGGFEPAEPSGVELPAPPPLVEPGVDRLALANPSLGRRVSPAVLLKQVARERTEAELQRDQAYERVDELDAELGQVRAALRVGVDADLPEAARAVMADRDRLGEHLGARVRDLDTAQARIAQLEQHVRALTAERNDERTANAALHREIAGKAAANVLEQQVRYRCGECGRRYGLPFTDHEHGPLTPVVVTIARADRPGTQPSKEQ